MSTEKVDCPNKGCLSVVTPGAACKGCGMVAPAQNATPATEDTQPFRHVEGCLVPEVAYFGVWHEAMKEVVDWARAAADDAYNNYQDAMVKSSPCADHLRGVWDAKQETLQTLREQLHYVRKLLSRSRHGGS